MADGNDLTDKKLEILHDHYKETFARLQQIESNRDRLFLWVIGLFALLSVEIGYPSAIGGTLGSVSVAGQELNLQALPLPALLNASWLLTAAMSLRYCQATIQANRQYPYLHSLEAVISPELGGGDIYRREGEVYLREYPMLLNVAWIAYGILFPLSIMFAAGVFVIWEAKELSYPVPNKLFDSVLSVAIIVFFFSYRIQPTIASNRHKFQEWRRNRKYPASRN